MLAHVCHHLSAQIRPPIEHRHDDASDLHAIVRAGVPNLLDHAHDLYQPLQREELALDRREQLIRRRERIRHEDAQRGRAIEQDEIERRVCTQRGQSLGQAREVAVHARDFDFRAGQVEIGWDEEHALQSRGQNLVDDGSIAEERLVQALAFHSLEAERAGRVRLRIEIDQEHALAGLRQRATEIHRCGRLPDSALLVCDRDNFHARGRINVRSSNVRRPSASCQQRCSGSGSISVTSNSPAFTSQR